jgi:uncharacterized protein (TIGR02996 family)
VTAARDDTERELRRRIVDDPDDDELRLVYADFLEELGELERAELIRAQIELAHVDRDDSQFWAVSAAVQRYQPGCVDALRLPPRVTGGFCRGLLGFLLTEIDAFVEHGPELAREHPIEALGFAASADPRRRLGELLEMSELGTIRSLSLEGYDPGPPRRDSPTADPRPRRRPRSARLHPTRPRRARGERRRLDGPTIAELARQPHRFLSVADNSLDDIKLELSPHLRGLDPVGYLSG